MSKIKLIAIMGKAASGKDCTLNKALYEVEKTFWPVPPEEAFGKRAKELDEIENEGEKLFHQKYNIVIPFTTRPPRDGEKDGREYHFVGAEQITDWIENGSIAQIADFNGWLYGTIWDAYHEDKINIGIFSPRAIEYLKNYDDMDVSVIQITASDKERLKRQLDREKNPDVKEIVRRYLADEEDFSETNLQYLEPYITISTSRDEIGTTLTSYLVPGERLKNAIIKLSGKEV